MTTLSKKKVRNAITGSMGIYAVIARTCGVSRSTITKFLRKERNIKILQEIEQEKEKILDIGEKKLIELVQNGEFPAIKFLLSTRGKNRGYVEKQEIEHSGTTAKIFHIIEKSVEEIKDAKNKRIDSESKADRDVKSS